MSTPAVLIWAQRNEQVYIKIDLQDVTKEKIDFTEAGHFTFNGTAGGRVYTADVQLFAEIDVAVRDTLVDRGTVFHALLDVECLLQSGRVVVYC
jgi:hypothetical protein